MIGKEAQTLLEQDFDKGQVLAERWSNMPGNRIRGYSRHKRVNFLEGIEKGDTVKRAMLGTLYENAYNQLRRLDETTRMLQVGSWKIVLQESPSGN